MTICYTMLLTAVYRDDPKVESQEPLQYLLKLSLHFDLKVNLVPALVFHDQVNDLSPLHAKRRQVEIYTRPSQPIMAGRLK